MKIRADFVTNSSSSSYLIVLKDDQDITTLTDEELEARFNLAGIPQKLKDEVFWKIRNDSTFIDPNNKEDSDFIDELFYWPAYYEVKTEHEAAGELYEDFHDKLEQEATERAKKTQSELMEKFGSKFFETCAFEDFGSLDFMDSNRAISNRGVIYLNNH